MTVVNEPDITLASTTESQEELDHATGPNWREHFQKPEVKESETKETPAEPPKGETKTPAESGPAKPGAKGESGAENEDDGLPKGARKRIDRLTARLREAEEELSAMRRGSQRTEPAQQPKPAANADPEPQLKDFKTWEEWNSAHVRWSVRDENRKESAKNQQTEAEQASRERYEAHTERVQDYEADHPDFRDKVAGITMTFSSEQANIAFQLAVVEADNGPAILDYLADHPDEMAKFSELSPVRAQMAVGRISAALSPSTSQQAPPKPSSQSRTPAPASQVKRPSTATGTNYLDPDTAKKMTDDEWIRQREADVRARKSRR